MLIYSVASNTPVWKWRSQISLCSPFCQQMASDCFSLSPVFFAFLFLSDPTHGRHLSQEWVLLFRRKSHCDMSFQEDTKERRKQGSAAQGAVQPAHVVR